MLSTGDGVSWPRPHNEPVRMPAASSLMRSRSAIVPLPSVMRVSTSSIRVPPTRQGMHLPQLSAAEKVRKNLLNSTMQVSSSTTIMPPEPIVAPAAVRLS